MTGTTVGLGEAAVMLKVTYQFAYNLLATGRLRGHKKGGRWYVRLDDVRIRRGCGTRPRP